MAIKECVICGVQFRAASRGMVCSPECRLSLRKIQKAKRMEDQDYADKERAYIRDYKKSYKKQTPIKIQYEVRACAICGCEFANNIAFKTCSTECSNALRFQREREYRQRPDVKEREREYRQRPDVKEKERERERTKTINRSPEYLLRKRERERVRRSTPEAKEKIAQYDRHRFSLLTIDEREVRNHNKAIYKRRQVQAKATFLIAIQTGELK